MEISKEMFQKYIKVQASGRYNMITEARFVMNEIGASKAEYLAILENYSDLRKKFGSNNE